MPIKQSFYRAIRFVGVPAYADTDDFKDTVKRNGVLTLQITCGSHHERGDGCGYDVPFQTKVRVDAKNGKGQVPPYYALNYKECWPSLDEEEERLERTIKSVKNALSEFSFLEDVRIDDKPI